MPNPLHANLRHGIDFESANQEPGVLLEDLPGGHDDLEHRAAKRRRIATVAAQYLCGKTPVILSASLNGPFDQGWKNPWAKVSRKGSNAPLQNNGEVNRGAHINHITRQSKHSTSRLSPPSPEASRSAENASLTVEPTAKEHPIENPPSIATAEQNHSGRTNFSSAEDDAPITFDTSESNIHWLRRHSSDPLDIDEQTDSTTAPSPTKARGRCLHSGAQRRYEIAASMALSSPIKSAKHIYTMEGNDSRARRKRSFRAGSKQTRFNDAASSQPIATTSHINLSSASKNMETVAATKGVKTLQNAQTSVMEIGQSTTPTNDQEMITSARSAPSFTSINVQSPGGCASTTKSIMVSPRNTSPQVSEGHGCESTLALRGLEQNGNHVGNTHQLSRETILRSAERCANVIPHSVGILKNQESKRKTQKAPRDQQLSKVSMSSNTVTPDEAGVAKVANNRRQKSKPRPVTFSSSPAVGKDHRTNTKLLRHEPHQSSQVSRSARQDIYEVPVESPNALDRHQSLRASRNSRYSTQAALMLAHLEFQEGLKPPIAEEYSKFASRSQGDTPYRDPQQPCLEYTPYSVFNAELAKRYPSESIPNDVSISTQDLFQTASPFAFSTVKKKPTRAQRSSLKFTEVPNEELIRDTTHNGGPKSPTLSRRVPLKEKNSTVSFAQSAASEKGSQDSVLEERRLSMQDVELPQLDFHTSLDDLGPNGGFDFTDHLLRNLGDVS